MESAMQTNSKHRLTDITGKNNGIFRANASSLSLLEKFVPEERGNVDRKAVVGKETAAVSAMLKTWGKGRGLMYVTAMEWAESASYGAKDVERFSLHMVELQDEPDFRNNAGLFLSALVNAGKDEDYIIHTHHLSQIPNRLGFQNAKSLTIIGEAGTCLGEKMTGGAIALKGDAGNSLGYHMHSGRIEVAGNAQDNAGEFMYGGLIAVMGNAGKDVGMCMHGGIIEVHGKIASIDSRVGERCSIYERGKLVFGKG